MILKTYKYRMYPTKDQASFLDQVFGDVRFVWNQLVANFNSWVSNGPNCILNEKKLKDDPEFFFLKNSISYALQQKRIDFEETKKQYFSKTRKTKVGKPKFKKKGISRDSFRIPAASMNFKDFSQIKDGKIKLPKMSAIKIVIDRSFTGKPKSVTVSKNKCGQYFVSCLIEEEPVMKPNTGRSVGIDLGLIDLVTSSTGIKVKAPRLFRESQSKLKRAQQHLSRKQKGSNRYNKQKLKVARIHNKITNQRSWFIHNLTTLLVNNFDHIIMEDLNVKGMMKLFGKSISDAAFGEILRQLEYKCNWYGKGFHKIDRWFPSSKTCSNCGHKMSKDQMDLSVRSWTCTSCNNHHDRDLNAAINILHEGLKDLYGFTSDELADYKRREEVRHARTDAFLNEAFSKFYKNL